MKLPHIIAVKASETDMVILEIEISPQLEAFCGHFPNNPILSGVAQIDWVVRFAVMHFGVAVAVARNFQVKFRNIIRPQMPIALTLKVDRARNKLSFVYQSGTEIMSSGKMTLEAMT